MLSGIALVTVLGEVLRLTRLTSQAPEPASDCLPPLLSSVQQAWAVNRGAAALVNKTGANSEPPTHGTLATERLIAF